MARIMIIDDDPLIRRLVVRTLAGAGHDAIEAQDGQQGLDLFRAEAPVLVITDIFMPNQEGIETIQELRRDAPDLPILAISGGGRSRGLNYLEYARKLGANEALAKPFRPAELLEVVNRML